MGFLLREIFPEYSEKVLKKGDYAVVNTKAFYDKTGFVLAKKKKNISYRKPRPLIVVDVKSNETVNFVATTTDLGVRGSRPKISLKNCEFFKEKNECLGIDPKRNSVWLFAKKTKSKKRRFYYDVDIYTIRDLIKEGNLVICGKCKEKTILEIKLNIENNGEVL